MTKATIKIIEYIILFVWAVIAPIFWLPFLVRMIALFIGAVVVAAGGEGDLSVAQLGLDRAARFYPEGFINIRQSLSSIASGNINRRASWTPGNEFWKPLFIHLASAFVFWGITAISLISLVAA